MVMHACVCVFRSISKMHDACGWLNHTNTESCVALHKYHINRRLSSSRLVDVYLSCATLGDSEQGGIMSVNVCVTDSLGIFSRNLQR